MRVCTPWNHGPLHSFNDLEEGGTATVRLAVLAQRVRLNG